MLNEIKLTHEVISKPNDIKNHEDFNHFEEFIQCALSQNVKIHCLFGSSGSKTKLLFLSSYNHEPNHSVKKLESYLNHLLEFSPNSIAECAAVLTIIDSSIMREGLFEVSRNSSYKSNPQILQEITTDSFGYLLWDWQLMMLVNFYIPSQSGRDIYKKIKGKIYEGWEHAKHIRTDNDYSLYDILLERSVYERYTQVHAFFGGNLFDLL